MAAAKGQTGSVQTHIFGKAGHSTLSDPPVYADIVAAGKLVPALGANRGELIMQTNYIGDVIDIGDLGDAANILRFSPFGAPVEKTLAGIASLPEWTFTVALAEDDTAHAAIRSASNGDQWEFAIVTVTKFTATVEATVDYAKGQLASKPKSFSTGDATAMVVTVALEESPRQFDAT